MFSEPGGGGGKKKVKMFLSAKLLIIYYKRLKILSPWEFCVFTLVCLLQLQKTELICLFFGILLLKINPITVSSKMQCQRTVLFM